MNASVCALLDNHASRVYSLKTMKTQPTPAEVLESARRALAQQPPSSTCTTCGDPWPWATPRCDDCAADVARDEAVDDAIDREREECVS